MTISRNWQDIAVLVLAMVVLAAILWVLAAVAWWFASLVDSWLRGFV